MYSVPIFVLFLSWITSGEQFVAIPRSSCASHVDPTAAGVPELVNLGIRHLDLHDTGAKHALRSVVDVERQVQVVNGVRYIFTLLVDYDNCTAHDAQPCPVSTPCKISVLEKPWRKLPDGSKYRAILANNCTIDWLFGDEGEVLPAAENNENSDVTCDENKLKSRAKRQIPGGQIEQSPDDPKYKQLAQESLDKYRATLVGGELNVKELKVTKVTTQVVFGPLTRIDFTVVPTNGEAFTCHSKIWELPWLKEKEIDVNCDVNKYQARAKRQVIAGGETEENPDDPKYKQLAQESLDKYRATNPGGELNVKELKVTRVTTQVVTGTKTRIDFTVIATNGEAFTCHSKVWEDPVIQKKDINVTCDENTQQSRAKRQIPGGQTEQSSDDPKYKQLAQESLDKYRATLVGGELNVKELKVTRVTTQVVTGIITRIDFTVIATNGEAFTCHSKVWEDPVIQKKDIDVTCDENTQQSRAKRQIPGGQTEQSRDDPKYKQLAQESLDKYRATLVGGELNVKELKVTKVTTQVVAGTSTRIDFTVVPQNGEAFTCHSKLWEQPWLKKKEIDVNCDVNKQESRAKRQIK